MFLENVDGGAITIWLHWTDAARISEVEIDEHMEIPQFFKASAFAAYLAAGNRDQTIEGMYRYLRKLDGTDAERVEQMRTAGTEATA